MTRDEKYKGPDFKRLLEGSPHPYLVLLPDAAFTIVAVNDRYLAATATRRPDILGCGLFEVFPDNPNDNSSSSVNDLRVSLERVLHDKAQDIMGVQKYDIPISGVQDAFEVKYWSPVNTPVFDEEGDVAYIFIMSKISRNSCSPEKIPRQKIPILKIAWTGWKPKWPGGQAKSRWPTVD